MVACGCSRSRGRGRSSPGPPSASARTTLLSGKVEQVDIVLVIETSRRRRGGSGGGGSGSGSGSTASFTSLRSSRLRVLGNTLQSMISYDKNSSAICTQAMYRQEILHGAFGVVEGRTHGRVDLGSLESHRLYICDSLSALLAHRQGIGIKDATCGRGRRCSCRSGRRRRSSCRSSDLRGRSRGRRR